MVIGRRLGVALAGVVVLGGGLFAGMQFDKVGATSNLPADKVTVAAADIDTVGTTDTPLLKAVMKTSTPEDLILQVTLECSIFTTVTTAGTGTQTATGQIRVWVTIDGKAVPVVSLPSQQNNQKPTAPNDDGHVTFCNRTHTQTVNDADAGEGTGDTISEYLATKEANGFNWAAFNVGFTYGTSNTHTIVVHGEFTNSQTAPCSPTTAPGPTGCSNAIVGNRTLVVQPTSLALDQPNS